jgi:Mannosyltransferase putative
VKHVGAQPDHRSLGAATAELRRVAQARHPYPAERFAGRGIVICAGGARLLTCAWVAVNVLRRILHCSLPIQLWHIGPRELGPLEASLFDGLDVEVVDALACATVWPARTLGGWELKAYALVHSRFERALLLDADNVAVVDPSYLFDLPQLADTGLLVWPDVERLTAENPIWELCGVAFRSEPAWESGQLLVDKRRCWHALQLALHMNMHSEVFYPFTMGDKETFHLAWLISDAPWAMPAHPARGTATGIYQRDFEGRLLFQHRSGAKWRLTGPNELAANFQHQADCLRFLDELRERWSGRIDAVPPRSPRDMAVEERLAEIRWVKLEEPGVADRLLELLSANRIGIGSARADMLRWYVRDDALIIDGVHSVLPVLRRRAGPTLAFASAPGGRELALRPAPDAGHDAVGAVALAVLERLAGEGVITEDDAVTTLSTLGETGDLTDALDVARARWPDGDAAGRVIERAAARIGRRNASENMRERPGYERLP